MRRWIKQLLCHHDELYRKWDTIPHQGWTKRCTLCGKVHP